MSFRTIAACLLLLVGRAVMAGSVERVEPPFWWTGFEHRELQLLVHGDGAGMLDASIDYPGVALRRVERVDSDNYLFLYLELGDATRPGKVPILFRDGDRTIIHEYELRERSTDPNHARGFSAADVIYLVTPDRFANGDADNDAIDGYGDATDRSDNTGRHGGDLAGIRAALDYVADMGFTAIWLNPVLENRMPEASYHGYATTDFYRVDSRFGSNEEYRRLVQEARRKGIGIIMDMITNHCGSEHWWMHDLPSKDWLNSTERYRQTNSAKTTILDPYASASDREAYFDGWYVPTMPDLNQRNPLLADYLTQNAIWWIEYLGLSGIRLDTYSFSDTAFLSEWARRIMLEYPSFNITGEETVADPALLAYWQRGKNNHDGYVSHTPSLLDFPLYHALNDSLTAEVEWWDSPWRRAYEVLGKDYEYPDPDNLVIFPDNHDQSRLFTKVGRDESLFRMAIVYYLTMRGIPQIYYGTEVLMAHPRDDGNHGEIRAEFPGGWPDHEKNAFTGKGLTAAERDAQALVRKLLHWRKVKPVVHSGRLMQYTPQGSVYSYFRYDDDDTVMVIFNRGPDRVSVDPARFAERLQGAAVATDVLTGTEVALDRPLDMAPMSVLLLEVR